MSSTQTSDEAVEWLLLALERAERLDMSEAELYRLRLFGGEDGDSEVRLEEWRELVSTLAPEAEGRHRDATRRRFQETISARLISSWAATAGIKSYVDIRALGLIIATYRRSEHVEQLADFLRDVAARGFEKANRKRKRDQWGGGYFGHAWATLTGVARLILAFILFSVAESKFQTIVFALLVLIYNGLDGGFKWQAYQNLHATLGSYAQYKTLLRGARCEELESERAERVAQEVEAEKSAVRNVVRFWIGAVFIGLTWMLAAWELVSALFF